jgi:hypothetical protein
MIYGLVQLAGALAAAAGTYLLLGLAPTLVILGGATFAGALLLEIMGSRRPAPLPRARRAPEPAEEPEPAPPGADELLALKRPKRKAD